MIDGPHDAGNAGISSSQSRVPVNNLLFIWEKRARPTGKWLSRALVGYSFCNLIFGMLMMANALFLTNSLTSRLQPAWTLFKLFMIPSFRHAIINSSALSSPV